LDYVIEQCGLRTVLSRLIGQLSKGFQQRVGIAQAIVHNPAVVILDEPTIGLDPMQIFEIRGLIRHLGQEHGIILSTHILSEVQAVCSHVQIINQGELILSDTITGLLTHIQTTHLQIGLRRPPDIQELLQISGVKAVESVDESRFRIRYAAENSPAEMLVTQSVAHNWGLYELIPEQRSLEQVFVDLMRIEETEQPELAEKN
jgi:ABC-2 type transport system ATP-binding protein